MKKEILYLIIGLLVGAFLGALIIARDLNKAQKGDLNLDNKVDIQDWSIFQHYFNEK